MQLVPGTVYLVGAGPGAADLLTVRALRILQSASALLHDALVEPEVLALANPGALTVAVGKRGYCVGSTRQEHINDRLVDLARAGHTVCRLKGGDPGVFGRGGEEAEVLAANGVPFVFVPGVTAALAAAAAANVPLTHRAAGQSVAFLTGHHDPDSPECTHDWRGLATLGGLVVYMGIRHLPAVVRKLAAAGLDPGTPAALVAAATTPRERVLALPLAGFALPLDDIDGPAVLLVGAAVGYRERYATLAAAAVADAPAAGVY